VRKRTNGSLGRSSDVPCRRGGRHGTCGIGRLEQKLNTKLFDKLASGYRLTEAGSDIVELAGHMSTASSQIEARVFGRDQNVSGPLRFTLPVSFASDLLMPTLVEFRASYPEIALEVISSGSVVNLGNREADVALRVMVGGVPPPDNLYGTRLCEFHTGFYVHRGLMKAGSSARPAWLLGQGESIPDDWEPADPITMASTPIRFTEMRSQFEAARAGIGVSLLPCFLGDADAALIRVPGAPVTHIGDVWLLTHGDTRRTKRVRLLCDKVRKAVQGFAARLEGQAADDVLGL
jgi:DNA-binding transcriptional LysR family regulator